MARFNPAVNTMHGQSSTCTGIEHKVQQRSLEWFSLRRNTLITASQFGDAIGVGRGKPFDFFLSLISEDSILELDDNLMSNLQHGIDTEIIIKEAYEMLTGNSVRDSGFWVPNKDSPLKSLIGASPDGVVVDRDCPENIIGLTEFKAPVHKMYSGNDLDLGIPRQYMAQIQGQMAVVGAPWCDFLAVCTKTREIMLKRVHFHPLYWLHVSDVIRQFCYTLQVSLYNLLLWARSWTGGSRHHIHIISTAVNNAQKALGLTCCNLDIYKSLLWVYTQDMWHLRTFANKKSPNTAL